MALRVYVMICMYVFNVMYVGMIGALCVYVMNVCLVCVLCMYDVSARNVCTSVMYVSFACVHDLLHYVT